MKRASSEPNLLHSNDDSKRPKLSEVPSTREYLQLALIKILEMQRQIKEDSPFDCTSDLGDSETEEDTMKDVLVQVFKDLPGSSQSTVSIIEKAMKPGDPRLNVIRGKSIQLAGYDTCRRVALDFMKNVVKLTPDPQNNDRSSSSQRTQNTTDFEVRMRMFKSLDLHLAVKQRDYIAKLMRQ